MIRGAASTYGVGWSGWVINFITDERKGDGGREAEITADVAGQDDNRDSLDGRVYQGPH